MNTPAPHSTYSPTLRLPLILLRDLCLIYTPTKQYLLHASRDWFTITQPQVLCPFHLPLILKDLYLIYLTAKRYLLHTSWDQFTITQPQVLLIALQSFLHISWDPSAQFKPDFIDTGFDTKSYTLPELYYIRPLSTCYLGSIGSQLVSITIRASHRTQSFLLVYDWNGYS